MRGKLLFTVIAAIAALWAPAAARATEAPAWSVVSVAAPTNFAPGDAKNPYFQVQVSNVGSAPTDRSPIKIVDTLPSGLGVKDIELKGRTAPGSHGALSATACHQTKSGSTVTVACEVAESTPGGYEPAWLTPGQFVTLLIRVSVPKSAAGELLNSVTVEGGGARSFATEATNQVSESPAAPGISQFSASLADAGGEVERRAATHPYAYTTSFVANTELAPTGAHVPLLQSGGDPKDLEFDLPPGLLGDPTAIPRCTAAQFVTLIHLSFGGDRLVSGCPDSTAVGTISVQQVEGGPGGDTLGAVYNLVPPPGMPAQFGFQLVGAPIYIDTAVRSGSDYGVTARVHNVSQTKRVTSATVTLWGVPGDSSHDPARGVCAELGAGICPSEGPVRPFLRLPTACGGPLVTSMRLRTWLHPDTTLADLHSGPGPTACSAPPFAPSIEAKATTSAADSPSGLHFDLHNPQPQDPEAPGEADLKDATVTLPEGFVVNPSSADGLGACSEAQVGYTGIKDGRPSFTAVPAVCPDASKIGTVTVKTPLVDHPLSGAVYLARQEENPFGSLLAIYIAVDDPQTGVVVKLAGRVTPDPATGRLTTTVEQSPQLPFEDFELDFFEGARAPLRTPATCGTHTTTTTLVPWSSPEGPTAHPQGAFQTTSPAAGVSTCPTGALPSSWAFSAGAQAPLAGAYSPFTVHLARPDGSQELSSLEVTLPPGVAARFAGVPECSGAQIAAAKAREVPGQGKAEQHSPSCPAASRIGTATVAAGAGPSPYHVTGGAYLAGPYKGAPFSIVVVTPAVAGPFDLGAVVVRSALDVDPFTAQGTVRSDPIPRLLDGIPLDVRSLTVAVDRPGFTLNPTSCEAKSVTGAAVSASGARTELTNRFQVGECAALKFRPKLKIRLKGATRRIGHPALRAVLTASPGEADIGRAQVNLPHGEFLDQGNLNKTCTRPVLLASACPPSSVYGKAKAWTPLLDKPLEGPVYLVGGFGYKLPALVAELDGQVKILLVGKVDSGKNKGIRNTFEMVPDAPVSRFVLEMKGGKKYGLLENSENLCKAKKSRRRAIVRFVGQNGKVRHFKPVVRNDCGKGKKKQKKEASHRRSQDRRGGGQRHHRGR